jgi:hypothetical protein
MGGLTFRLSWVFALCGVGADHQRIGGKRCFDQHRAPRLVQVQSKCRVGKTTWAGVPHYSQTPG